MKAILLFVLITILASPLVHSIEQTCVGDSCVQIGSNQGTINFTLQIAVNEGEVKILSEPKDREKISNLSTKIANLESQISGYLQKLARQEQWQLTDSEKLHSALSYTDDLLAQLAQREKRISKLDGQHDLTRRIKAAKDEFNVPLIKQLLKEKQRLDDKWQAQAAETAFELAGFQKIDLEYREAYSNYQKAVFLQGNNGEFLNAAGSMANILGEYDEAIGYLEQALDIALAKFIEGHPWMIVRPNTQGEGAGMSRTAAIQQKVVVSDLKSIREMHLDVAVVRNNLGESWLAKGEYDKAIGYFERALNTGLRHFGEDHTSVATMHNNLGVAWHAKGEVDKAIGYIEQALDSDLKRFGEDHPKVAVRHNNLGLAWKAKGEYDKAIGYYEQALASDLETFGEGHPEVAVRHSNLGSVWHAKGEVDKAIGYYELALKVCYSKLGEEHPYTKSLSGRLQMLKSQMASRSDWQSSLFFYLIGDLTFLGSLSDSQSLRRYFDEVLTGIKEFKN